MASGYPDGEGRKSKVWLKPEWSAVDATDKNFYKFTNNIAVAGSNDDDYAVPAGVTLYIVFLAVHGFATNAADKDLMQICDVRLLIAVPLELLAVVGGNGGAQTLFSKPVPIEGGLTARFSVDNRSNHAMSIGYTALGYEV